MTDVTNPHCICYGNFTGSNCQNCTEGHWGANCTVCPACVYGTCNQYVEGNGKCNCDWQYAGDLCTIHWWYYFLFCLLLTICFTVAFIITWCSVRLCFAICKKRAEKKKKMRIKQGINHESDPILVFFSLLQKFPFPFFNRLKSRYNRKAMFLKLRIPEKLKLFSPLLLFTNLWRSRHLYL